MGSVPTLLGVILITFAITRLLPGDPAAYFAGPSATEESVAQIRESLGLDEPLVDQFFGYANDLLRGDWGDSLSTGQPVFTELLTRLPASLELTMVGLFFAVMIGLPMGILAAYNSGSWIDHLCRVVATAGVAIPTFFAGLLLIFVFYYLLDWAPPPMDRLDVFTDAPNRVTGFFLIDSLLSREWATFVEALKQIILPAIALGLFAMAPLARMTRASLLGVLSSDYLKTAKANGLSQGKILVHYALRNAMLPIVTTMGMIFSYLLGINVLVEKVFAWPGIGSYALEALVVLDYGPVQGFTLCMGLIFVFLNILIDIIYGLLDPRVN